MAYYERDDDSFTGQDRKTLHGQGRPRLRDNVKQRKRERDARAFANSPAAKSTGGIGTLNYGRCLGILGSTLGVLGAPRR